MGFLAGKKALIVGLATDRSIAYGISQAMRREGAELAFSYQNERIKDRVVEIAGELGSKLVMPMDVGIDAEIDAAFARLKAEWPALDVLVHSVAFAPREALTGGFVEATTRESFAVAHDVSSYSLAALAKKAEPAMRGRNGALLTLSYLGAVRTLPNYNVMGLAKASLAANVRFLAVDLGDDPPVRIVEHAPVGDRDAALEARDLRPVSAEDDAAGQIVEATLAALAERDALFARCLARRARRRSPSHRLDRSRPTLRRARSTRAPRR